MAIRVARVVVAGDLGAAWPLALAVVAELVDRSDRLRTGSWRLRDALADIADPVLWPFVLFCLARAGAIRRASLGRPWPVTARP